MAVPCLPGARQRRDQDDLLRPLPAVVSLVRIHGHAKMTSSNFRALSVQDLCCSEASGRKEKVVVL